MSIESYLEASEQKFDGDGFSVTLVPSMQYTIIQSQFMLVSFSEYYEELAKELAFSDQDGFLGIVFSFLQLAARVTDYEGLPFDFPSPNDSQEEIKDKVVGWLFSSSEGIYSQIESWASSLDRSSAKEAVKKLSKGKPKKK